MKADHTCFCTVPIYDANQKYCQYCRQDKMWETFLNPKRIKNEEGETDKDQIDIEKSISQLGDAIKKAKEELSAAKKRDKEEELMLETQAQYIKRFVQNVPDMQNKIRTQLLKNV